MMGHDLFLGLSDLEGLQQVLALYLRYLNAQSTTSPAGEQRRQLLANLRARIAQARLSRHDPVSIPLTLVEWQGLKKALNGCAWVIRTSIPATAERDDLLEVLERLKQKIARIISASLN
ncbi:MAG: hypothetical protein ACRDHW_21360 [Ktedonobacteraceae bacterium]